MKRLFPLLPVLAFLFAGCGEKTYDVVVTNNSTKTVTYSYNGSLYISDPSPDPTAAQIFTVKPYTQPPVITVASPIKSVKMVYNGDDGYTIEDVDSIPLTVTNNSGIAVTLKAGEYMTPLPLAVGATESTSIYTSSPVFTTEHSTIYVLSVSHTTSGGSMTATINAP